MKKIQVVLREVDPSGQTFHWDDQEIWSEPLSEFHLPCRIVEDIKAEVFVLPEKVGCLFRGKLTGTVALACDRCAEETIFPISFEFDEFEGYPKQNLEDGDDDEEDNGENRVVIIEDGVTLLDFGALLWEEFILTLPTKPLCNNLCKGVCPQCGKNLNEGMCACEDEDTDPRMEALRNLKIQ